MSLALLGLPFAADDVAARELPPAGARWIELRSANFTFTSNTGTSATRRIALDLEELRSALAGLTDFELRSPVPTSIFIFKSDRSFTPYKTLYRGRPADIAGYFLGRDHGNYIAIEAGSRRASEIMYHEYVHFVMDTNLWFLPPWLAEGLAEFYQTFEVSGDRVSIGLPGWSHVQRLQGRTLIPFAELIEVDYDSPLYNEAVRKSDFYAQAWAVTHYLLLGSRDRRAQLDHCLGLLRAGIDPVEAVNRAFGDDLQALDGEVRRHIRGPAMPSLRTTRELEYDTSLQARELSRAELLYRLGDLLSAQRSRRDESLRHFEAAIEADPDHGRTWSALALMAEERADWSSARSAHARAVEASPNDPVLLYRWGRYLERRSDDSAEAVRVLRRAAEIDPSFAPAWKALSTIYADLGTTSREALQAAVTAHRLLPSDAVAADTLVRLCLRIDDRQCAVDVIATTFAGDRRRAGNAWQGVLNRDLDRARELIDRGDYEEARRQLDRAEADVFRAAHPDLLRQAIEAARRSVTRHEAAAVYDRAARLYANGDAAAARELLLAVVQRLPAGDPVAWSSERLLQAIDRPPPEASEVASPSPTPDEIAELNRLLAASRFEAALGHLREVRERAVGEQLRWVDAKIDEIEWTLDYNRYVEAYNRAVDLYNSGHHHRAAAVCEQLLQELPEGPRRDAVSELLTDALAAAR